MVVLIRPIFRGFYKEFAILEGFEIGSLRNGQNLSPTKSKTVPQVSQKQARNSGLARVL